MSTSPSSSVELVITAPGRYGSELAYATRARTTLGVLTQLFAEAKRKVVLTAPFVQGQAVLEMGVLADAIRAALDRDICIDIMTTRSNLELSVFHELARAYRGQIRLFHPAFPFAELSELGSHAKFCISDEEAAYVGSANLTASALGGAHATSPHSRQHFEMGVLVRGQVAGQLYQLWVYTVRYGIFVELDRD